MVASDRGQVLLLGGLAMAIVFLTAIPLSNSLVVTESASSSGAVSDIDRAAEREASVERGVRALLSDVNISHRDAVNRSLRNFSAYYTNVSGQQGGVYVNATVDYGASTRTLTASDFTVPGGPNGNTPWSPVNESTRISALNITFDQSATTAPPSQRFRLEVKNDSGVQYTVEAYRDNPGNELVVVSDDGSPGTTECRNTDDITISIVGGKCYYPSKPSTSAEQFSSGGGEYDVSIVNKPNQVSGSFTLTADGDFYDGIKNDPDYDLGMGQPAVSLTYTGPDASYERTILVNDSS